MTTTAVSAPRAPGWPPLLWGILAGIALGAASVATWTFGLVSDSDDSTAESLRTIAVSVAAAAVLGLIVYRIARGGLANGANSVAKRALVIGAVALVAGIPLFWSGLWGAPGIAAVLLGVNARREASGRSRSMATGAVILGVLGLVAGIVLVLVA